MTYERSTLFETIQKSNSVLWDWVVNQLITIHPDILVLHKYSSVLNDSAQLLDQNHRLALLQLIKLLQMLQTYTELPNFYPIELGLGSKEHPFVYSEKLKSNQSKLISLYDFFAITKPYGYQKVYFWKDEALCLLELSWLDQKPYISFIAASI